MFYSLSKALLFILQPEVWLAVILIYALWTQSRRKKRRSVILAAILFFLLGNSCIQSAVMQGLEWPRSNEEVSHHRYAILLGGYGMYNEPSKGFELNTASDRLFAAVDLYSRGKVEKILVSSGVTSKQTPFVTEAAYTKDILIGLGIPEEDIITEEFSWNTHENALHTAKTLRKIGGESSSILITSAFHMKRAMMCFEKQGLAPEPYPVDFHINALLSAPYSCLLPSLRTVMDWKIPLKEWVGTFVYGLKGYV